MSNQQGVTVKSIDTTTDAIYSPDDGWWYLQRGNETSQPFYDYDAMLKAYDSLEIDWQE